MHLMDGQIPAYVQVGESQQMVVPVQQPTIGGVPIDNLNQQIIQAAQSSIQPSPLTNEKVKV